MVLHQSYQVFLPDNNMKQWINKISLQLVQIGRRIIKALKLLGPSITQFQQFVSAMLKVNHHMQRDKMAMNTKEDSEEVSEKEI